MKSFIALVLLVIACCITSQAQTDKTLQSQYEKARQQCFGPGWSLGQTEQYCGQMEDLAKLITARDLIEMQKNTLQFDELNKSINTAAAELYALAYKKQCHQNLWRLITRYKEPTWCAR